MVKHFLKSNPWSSWCTALLFPLLLVIKAQSITQWWLNFVKGKAVSVLPSCYYDLAKFHEIKCTIHCKQMDIFHKKLISRYFSLYSFRILLVVPAKPLTCPKILCSSINYKMCLREVNIIVKCHRARMEYKISWSPDS